MACSTSHPGLPTYMLLEPGKRAQQLPCGALPGQSQGWWDKPIIAVWGGLAEGGSLPS